MILKSVQGSEITSPSQSGDDFSSNYPQSSTADAKSEYDTNDTYSYTEAGDDFGSSYPQSSTADPQSEYGTNDTYPYSRTGNTRFGYESESEYEFSSNYPNSDADGSQSLWSDDRTISNAAYDEHDPEYEEYDSDGNLLSDYMSEATEHGSDITMQLEHDNYY